MKTRRLLHMASIVCLFPHMRWKPPQSLCVCFLVPYLSSLPRRRLASHFATDLVCVGIFENILQRERVIRARSACKLLAGLFSNAIPVLLRKVVLWPSFKLVGANSACIAEIYDGLISRLFLLGSSLKSTRQPTVLFKLRSQF